MAEVGRLAASSGYCRPHGLAGVDRLRAIAGLGRERWSVAAGVASLGFDRYRETDAWAAGSYQLSGWPALGLGAHWLFVDQGGREVTGAPALDVGLLWEAGRFRLAAAGLALNRPNLGAAGTLRPRFVAGAEFCPVDEFRLGLDGRYQSGTASAALGCEFLLVPQLAIRAGVGTDPLRYGAGVGLRVGPVGLDYAYGFHPQLDATHSVELAVAWD